jgi:hypothetical protein
MTVALDSITRARMELIIQELKEELLRKRVKLADRWIKEGREVEVRNMDGRSIDLASLRALHPPQPS